MGFSYIDVYSLKGRTAYHVAPARLSSDLAENIVAACFDGSITALSPNGKILWSYKSGFFIFDLCVKDINNDGVDEILATSADGKLYVLDAKGNLMWTFEGKGPLYQVDAGKLDGKNTHVFTGGVDRKIYILSPQGKLVEEIIPDKILFGFNWKENFDHGIIRHLKLADLYGENRDNLIINSAPVSNHSDFFVYEGNELDLKWRKKISPFKDGTSWNPMSLKIEPQGKDGAQIILASRKYPAQFDRILICGNDGEIISSSAYSSVEDHTLDYHYSMSKIDVAMVELYNGKVIIELSGPELKIYNWKLEQISYAKAPFAFSNLAVAKKENGPDEILLSSALNGDDNIYRLKLVEGWQNAFESLAPHGKAGEIARNLKKLSRQIEKAPVQKQKVHPDKPCIIEIAAVIMKREKVGQFNHYIAHNKWVRKQFPYKNIKFATVYWLSEKEGNISPDGNKWVADRRLGYDFTQHEILEFAERLEKEKTPFMIQLGHGVGGFLKLDTVEKLLKNAPENLLGFITSEMEPVDDSLMYYMRSYMAPIMDLCLKYGKKKVVFREKGLYWSAISAIDEIYNFLFNGKYKEVFVPCVEESNSRVPDISLAGRVGLWMSGAVNTWGCRIIGDDFRFNFMWEWNAVMCGHPFIRTLLAHASLGASFFMLHHGADNASGEDQFFREEDFAWTNVGLESFLPFVHMLGKGIIKPPSREEAVGISKFHLSFMPPSDRIMKKAFNAHEFHRFSEENEKNAKACSRLECFWGMSPTLEFDIGHYLYSRKYQAYSFIPPTPYGFIPIVPGLSQHQETDIYSTDGDDIYINNEKVDLKTASIVLPQKAREYSRQLPFVCEGGIFLQTVRYNRNHYRLYLIDPGYMDPRDRKIKLISQMEDNFRLEDVLTGSELAFDDNKYRTVLKAGTYRIIDAFVKKQSSPERG